MISNERSKTDKFFDPGAAKSCGSLFNAFVSHSFLDSLHYVSDKPFWKRRDFSSQIDKNVELCWWMKAVITRVLG